MFYVNLNKLLIMLRKVIIHFILILPVSVSLIYLTKKVGEYSPLIKGLSDIRFTDLYFSKIIETKSNDDIYIIDVGDVPSESFRKELSDFIDLINSEYKPKVIATDILFDKNFSSQFDEQLSKSLSNDNLIRLIKIETAKNINSEKKSKQIEFPRFSDLNLTIDIKNNDGYTNSLGSASHHPCIRYFIPSKNILDKDYYEMSLLVVKKYNKEIFSNYTTQNKNLKSKSIINYNIDFKANRISIYDKTEFYKLKDKIVLIGINTYKNNKPKYTEDTWYTPRNNTFLGRSEKDMYGVEIKATIISNLLNSEILKNNSVLEKILNYILCIISYFVILYFYLKLNESFILIKLITQVLGIISAALLSIFAMKLNYAIDFTLTGIFIILSCEIVELIDDWFKRYKFYNINKL